jgi:hypothetical protein
MILRLCRHRRPPKKEVRHVQLRHVTPSTTSCSLIRDEEEEENTRNIHIELDNDCSFSLAQRGLFTCLPRGASSPTFTSISLIAGAAREEKEESIQLWL